MIEEVRNETGWSEKQVENWIAAQSRKRGVMVPAEMRRLLAERTNKETGRTTVQRFIPGEDIEDRGQVRTRAEVYEVNAVNMFKRSGTFDNIVGQKSLEAIQKGLGFKLAVELKLRGHRDPDTGFRDEYPVIALQEDWENSGVFLHDIVRVTFSKRTLLNGRYRLWFADNRPSAPLLKRFTNKAPCRSAPLT